MKIVSPYTYDYTEYKGLCCDEPSLTVPDQSFTIKELLIRYTSGTMPPVYRDGYYEEDDEIDIDNVNPMERGDFDLVDAQQLSDEIREQQRIRSKQDSDAGGRPAKRTGSAEKENTVQSEELQDSSE